MAKQNEQTRGGGSEGSDREEWVDLETGEKVALDPSELPPSGGEPESERAAGRRRQPAVWKVALYIAGTGLLLALLVYIFPDFREFHGPDGAVYQSAFFLLAIPAIAAIWALTGMFSGGENANRGASFVALLIAGLSAAILIADLVTVPSPEESARPVYEREDMSPQELRDWRERRLYRQRQQPASTEQTP